MVEDGVQTVALRFGDWERPGGLPGLERAPTTLTR